MIISKSQGQTVLEIHTQKGLKLFNINRIRYIKSLRKGSVIYLTNLENVKTNYLIKLYDYYLPSPHFFRCHNSYLINCNLVDCFCSNEIILKENIRIPLSRSKKQLFKENLIELQMNS
jgi:two-component system LytT family response regulator